MTQQPKWLQLVAPAGAILLLALALLAPPRALAADNVVRVEPSGVQVAPGGSFHVKIIDHPTPATTAIWAIDVVFDPAVVTTTDQDCQSLQKPPGGIGAFACQVHDDNEDGTPETVKVLGVFVFSGSGDGLRDESTLADITFHAIGDAGACTDLHLRIRSHADKDGNETGALVQDGRACIEAAAPPSGTASPLPITPRTSEPTETPMPGATTSAATPSGAQQTGSPAQTAPTGGQGTATRSGAPTGGSETPQPDGQGSGDEDSGGTDTLVWVGAAIVALALVGGGAWWAVKWRGRRPPVEGPPS